MQAFETLLFAVDATASPSSPSTGRRRSMRSTPACWPILWLRRKPSARTSRPGRRHHRAGPKSFVAGADIGQFAGLDVPQTHIMLAQRGQAAFDAIEASPKPVVAAVNGFALGGGCELALACHLRVASASARFGQPEVNLGVIAGYGGTQRLARVVGRGVATEMLLTGDRVSAQRAYEIGLVNRVVPSGEVIEVARQFVLTIASKAPVAVAMTLQAIRASDLPLPQGLQQEAALFAQCAATDDFAEGVGAFLNRETPEFTGR